VVEQFVPVVAERVDDRSLHLVGADLDVLAEGTTGVVELLVVGH
jgi:hypothetical protein